MQQKKGKAELKENLEAGKEFLSAGLRDTEAVIDLDRIAWNMRRICEMAGPQTAVAAVVKADAYGHGAARIARTLMDNGASLLAVAMLSEALELKQDDSSFPVFIMGLTPDRYLDLVVKENIIQTIDSLHQARLISQAAQRQGKKAIVHIKVDTGFHRIGFSDTPEGIRQMEEACRLPGICAEGIFSHLVLLDDQSNKEQFDRFLRVVNILQERGITFRYRHLADSIASVDYPEYRLDMIRAGAIIYGLKGFHKGSLDIRQALTLRTRISHISSLEPGEGVSYDFTWRTQVPTRVGTLPIGYADGYPRNMRGKGMVTVHGVRVPVVGVICMDQMMIDLHDVPQAEVGDEVIIYGDGSGNTVSIQEACEMGATNKNEIVSRITRRVPRVYISGEC